MNVLFNVTNHAITEDQFADAKKSLGVREVEELPDDLARLWSAVPPQIDSVEDYVRPIIDWLMARCTVDDVIWVQGEWGSVLAVLDEFRSSGVRCVYSTTKRVAEEVQSTQGIQMMHLIKHVRFRDFPVH